MEMQTSRIMDEIKYSGKDWEVEIRRRNQELSLRKLENTQQEVLNLIKPQSSIINLDETRANTISTFPKISGEMKKKRVEQI